MAGLKDAVIETPRNEELANKKRELRERIIKKYNDFCEARPYFQGLPYDLIDIFQGDIEEIYGKTEDRVEAVLRGILVNAGVYKKISKETVFQGVVNYEVVKNWIKKHFPDLFKNFVFCTRNMSIFNSLVFWDRLFNQLNFSGSSFLLKEWSDFMETYVYSGKYRFRYFL